MVQKLKPINVRVTFTTVVQVPAQWEMDQVTWHCEENMCIGNVIHDLFHEMEKSFKEDRTCGICHRAELEVLNSTQH
jgi:hypothetical protein